MENSHAILLSIGYVVLVYLAIVGILVLWNNEK